MPHIANLSPRQNLKLLSGGFILGLFLYHILGCPESMERAPAPTISPVPPFSPDPLPNWIGAIISNNEEFNENSKLVGQSEEIDTFSVAEYNMFSEPKAAQADFKQNEDCAPTKGSR